MMEDILAYIDSFKNKPNAVSPSLNLYADGSGGIYRGEDVLVSWYDINELKRFINDREINLLRVRIHSHRMELERMEVELSQLMKPE